MDSHPTGLNAYRKIRMVFSFSCPLVELIYQFYYSPQESDRILHLGLFLVQPYLTDSPFDQSPDLEPVF